MFDSNCPDCRAESEEDRPEDSSVLTCIHCGYVGIWDSEHGGWRALKREEHVRLMDNEAFLDAMNFGMAFRAWRARDVLQLCAVIHSKLDRIGVSASLVDDLANEITAAGYHTHPTASDISALGLDKYGDDL